MNFQWYPGHMTKAKRMMQEDMKLVDLVIELLDARVPKASKNPDINEMARQKSRVVILNKADLGDPEVNSQWKEEISSKGAFVCMMDARSRNGMKEVNHVIEKACQEKFERDRKRGILRRPVRAMIVGIPNVGKSTFINSFAKKACTKTGNKPGVTKGKQWIKLNKDVELLDTPGILWPRFEDQKVGLHLAMIGSIKDEILNVRDLCLEIISFLMEYYPDILKEEAGIAKAVFKEEAESEKAFLREEAESEKAFLREDAENVKAFLNEKAENPDYLILQAFAKKRNCLGRGGIYDVERAAALLVDDFRSGKMGRISLERP